jgi:hypothetical protein
MGGTGFVGSSMRFACAPVAAIRSSSSQSCACLGVAASWSLVPLTHRVIGVCCTAGWHVAAISDRAPDYANSCG